MGFRQGSYAKVWSIEPKNDTWTKCRISISRKNKQTGEYEQDFSGFVDFYGTASAGKAARLREGDRIKLGDIDVTNTYNKERQMSFTNYKVFSFDIEDNTPPPITNDSDFMTIPEGDTDETPW